MKRPEPTARSIRRRQDSKEFLLILLLVVAVVALIQVLLFVTITRMGSHATGLHLEQVERGPQSRTIRTALS